MSRWLSLADKSISLLLVFEHIQNEEINKTKTAPKKTIFVAYEETLTRKSLLFGKVVNKKYVWKCVKNRNISYEDSTLQEKTQQSQSFILVPFIRVLIIIILVLISKYYVHLTWFNLLPLPKSKTFRSFYSNSIEVCKVGFFQFWHSFFFQQILSKKFRKILWQIFKDYSDPIGFY